MKISLSFLAIGKKHIKECLFIINSLIKNNKLNFVVVTDDPDSFINLPIKIIKIDENFNYNLKRKPLQEALKLSDISIMMDTDILIFNNRINFSILYNIPDGLYVTWRNDSVNFMGKKISINDKNEYFEKLKTFNNSNIPLQFIDEYFIILKLSDNEKKIEFIKNWNKYFEKTKEIQPNNGRPGAIEGLIIYLSAILSNINIYDIRDNNKILLFVKNFYHYNKEHYNCEVIDIIDPKKLI